MSEKLRIFGNGYSLTGELKWGKVSRKTVRLIRMTHHIEYELCEDEKEALLLENKLIREERPEYNHAKKSPETYYFIHFRPEEDGWLFKLSMRQNEKGDWKTYGAFKGHVMVRRALGALLRLLYIAEHSIDSAHLLPSVLLKNLTPMNYRFKASTDRTFYNVDMLDTLLNGISDKLFDILFSRIREQELLDQYIGKLILEDLEAVRHFYEKCCRRNYLIVEKMRLDSSVIPQQKLDDYLVQLALD